MEKTRILWNNATSRDLWHSTTRFADIKPIVADAVKRLIEKFNSVTPQSEILAFMSGDKSEGQAYSSEYDNLRLASVQEALEQSHDPLAWGPKSTHGKVNLVKLVMYELAEMILEREQLKK